LGIENTLPAVESCFARGAQPEMIFGGDLVCGDGRDNTVWPEVIHNAMVVYGSWEGSMEDVSEWVVVADVTLGEDMFDVDDDISLLCSLEDGCLATSTAVTDATYWNF
jgi:hypothetical protein